MHGDDYTPKRDSTRPALQNAVDVTDGQVAWAACQDGGRLHPTPPRQTDPTAGDLAGNAAGQTTLHVVKSYAVPSLFFFGTVFFFLLAKAAFFVDAAARGGAEPRPRRLQATHWPPTAPARF